MWFWFWRGMRTVSVSGEFDTGVVWTVACGLDIDVLGAVEVCPQWQCNRMLSLGYFRSVYLPAVTHGAFDTNRTKSIPTLSEFRSGSSWISLNRKDLGSLPSVVRVVMNVVPPTLSFTHSFLPFLSVNFVMSESKLLPVLTSIDSVSVFTASSTIPFLFAMDRRKECLQLAKTLASQEESHGSQTNTQARNIKQMNVRSGHFGLVTLARSRGNR